MSPTPTKSRIYIAKGLRQMDGWVVFVALTWPEGQCLSRPPTPEPIRREFGWDNRPARRAIRAYLRSLGLSNRRTRELCAWVCDSEFHGWDASAPYTVWRRALRGAK